MRLSKKVRSFCLLLGLGCLLFASVVWAVPSSVRTPTVRTPVSRPVAAKRQKPQATTPQATTPQWIEVRPIFRKKMARQTRKQKSQVAHGRKLPPRHPAISSKQALIKRKQTPRERAIAALLGSIYKTLSTHSAKLVKDPRDQEWITGFSRHFRGLFLSKKEKLAAQLRNDIYKRKVRKRNQILSGVIRKLIGFYLQLTNANKQDGIRLTNKQQDRARNLAGMTITPCCFTQPASVHGNNVAEATKSSLRWLVSKGFSDDVIQQFLVATYGLRILSVPPGKNLVVIPLLGALLALLFVVWLIWRWVQPSGTLNDEDDMGDEEYESDEQRENDESTQKED